MELGGKMQKKVNFYSENEDIIFNLKEKIEWQEFYDLLSNDDREALGVSSVEEYKQTWMDIIAASGEVCGTEIAPNAHQIEKEDLVLNDEGDVVFGPTMDVNIDLLRNMGLCGLGVKVANGGMGAPFFVDCTFAEMVARACPSTYLNIVWYAPVAHIIEQFGSQELIDTFVPRIAAGEISGSMALTEPGAGSDLSSMRSYGEIQPDGTYKLFGSKRFISNGCGAISLVLAKSSKDSEGLKGLSLFLVEQKIDGKRNFSVTKLEEKVALHGSATCELQFDGSVAHILGKEGEGFPYMLRLMNDARIAVGFQGIGTMEAAFRLAEQYANERETWGKPIAKHERVAEILLDMEVELRGFRSLCFQASKFRSLTYFIENKLKRDDLEESERKALMQRLAETKKIVRKWTPLVKWYVGEKAVEHARNCLQIHGGYGFSKEYKAEWLLRESLILSIYEGTSQIQGLMCMKDTLKDVIRNPMEFVEVAFGLKVAGLRETNSFKRKLLKCKQLTNSAIVSLMFRLVKSNIRSSLSDVNKKDVIKLVKILSKDVVKFENVSHAMLHAERVCEMKSLIAIGNCVVRDAAISKDREFIAERFLNKSLIRIQQLKAEIEMDDPVIGSRIAPATAGREAPEASNG